ncbi:MAG: acetate--CoA ligase family protein [Anaerolineaceae bacterium]|jgi:acetyltransferase|nr:acetate--CoA ligase family protein [Anaerolineaceae bacterium]
MDNQYLDGLMRPKSIAVLGASSDPTKIGHSVLKNIIDGGYEGKIYPINLKSEEILGIKCYKTMLDVPGEIDAAVVTIPAKFVLESIEEAGKKGVKGLIIITSGFSEVGNKEQEAELVSKAQEYGIRILGPNIVGTLSNAEKLNASFAPVLPLPGKGALVSQSGALLIAIDMATFTRRVGFEKLISIGNMSDVDFADLVEWLDQDENTSSISLYIEGFKDGRKFMDVARKVTKPIIALKAGVSAHGAAAAASHTGSLAGAAKVYGAAFQQSGIVQATDLGNLFDLSLALSIQPPMKGDNLLIITNGGGVGVLATDAAERVGLPLKFAPKDVQEELKKHMPAFGSAKNPVDLTGMAGYDWYNDSVRFSFAHEWVDGLAVLYCETAMTEPMDIAKGIKKAIDDSGIKDKPVCVSFVGGEKSEKAMQWLVENGIPAYGGPDLAISALSALREYALMKEIVTEPEEKLKNTNKSLALDIIKTAREDGRDALTEIEAKQVFAAYGLPITATLLAKTEEEAISMAKEVGFPIVMKIVSPEILHKSDAGGVKVNIKDEASCREAYNTIIENAKAYNPDANIHGIAIQEMAPWGTEVILGSVNDATFGPTMMFGLGGIFVEVLKDVTFRVAPVSKKSSLRMISEIRGAPILAGVRGEAPRDREVLAETISRYANMIVDLADEVSESDANPVLVYEEGKGVKVVDARIILKK